jgi:hypothetical protein
MVYRESAYSIYLTARLRGIGVRQKKEPARRLALSLGGVGVLIAEVLLLRTLQVPMC